MKCSACGASWDEATVKQTLLACPFCGEVLEKKKPKKTRKKKIKEKTLKDVLREIIGLKGEETLDDRDVTIGLISDLAPKMTKERRQLGLMYDIGAIRTIQGGCHKTKTEQQRICKKVSKQLSTDLDMEEDAAVDLAVEVCTAIYGRKMSVESPNKGMAISGAQTTATDGGQSQQGENSQTSAQGKEPEKKARKRTTSKSSSAQSSTQSAQGTSSTTSSTTPSTTTTTSAGQTASGAKPVISNAKASRPSQKSVLAGASMVKSQQTLQQAALQPNGQGGSSSQSNTGGNTKSSRGRKKATNSRKSSSRSTSTAQNTTTYSTNTNQGQSNWQPTPQQLQAYQYYTGKPYPQSAVPQSSGYQPWAPSYQPQNRYNGGNAQSNSGRQTGSSQSRATQNSGQQSSNSFRSRLGNANPSGNGGYAPSTTSQWLQDANNGDKTAMYQLGLQYLRGTDGIVQDTNEGLKWITGAANKGEENAQFMLGYLYYSGTEIPKNESEALKWFLKCVRPRDFEVQYIIGMIYAYGTTITPNYTEAFKWFYRAAKGGNVQAQFIMGEFYHHGYDMEVNEKEAANWYGKAAQNGHAKAQQMLDQLNRGVSSPAQTVNMTTQNIPPSVQSQISQAVQQAVEQTVQQVRQKRSASSRTPQTTTSQQNQSWSGQSSSTQQNQSWAGQSSPTQQNQNWSAQNTQTAQPQQQTSWQRQIGGGGEPSTRHPGWRQNYNVGVASSNRNYQTLPSESQYTLGQSYASKVNRKLLQEDEDDDWLNLSRKKGFSGSQT